MKEIDIYDETYLRRQLEVQKSKGWDLEKDLPWDLGVDSSKFLLPIDKKAMFFPDASKEQRRAISQLMGLIVASTISELESIANDLKGPTWDRFLKKYPVNPELYELGVHFYEDEQKHSLAFKKYIDLFAESVNTDPKDLRKLLPQSNKTLLGQIYKMNSLAGGMAIWWLIAAVEEESIVFYNYIRNHKASIDPLYYQLHRLHFEEEIRHKSYAFMMLKVHEEFAGTPSNVFFKKLDFIIAEVMNMTWTFNQLFKMKNLKKMKNHHPFFETLCTLSEMLGKKNPLEVLNGLFNEVPYISNTLHLGEQPHIKELLERFGVPSMPLPEAKKVEDLCTA